MPEKSYSPPPPKVGFYFYQSSDKVIEKSPIVLKSSRQNKNQNFDEASKGSQLEKLFEIERIDTMDKNENSMDQIETEEVKNGICPDCKGDLYDGPSGGLATNVICSECGHKFNVVNFFGVHKVYRITPK